MLRQGMVGGIVLLALGCYRTPVPAPAPPPATPPPSAAAGNGLQGAERDRWHHLAEGSELYPLAWILALEQPGTGKPFLDNPERFGLIADSVPSAENPYGLPIGMTAEVSRDLRFAGVQMVGVNCAACHVSELKQQGKRVALIDGAPNLFDLTALYRGLVEATAATFADVSKAWQFASRLHRLANAPDRPHLATIMPPDAAAVLDRFTDLASLRQGGELEKALAARIETIHREELRRPAIDLKAGLTVRSSDAALEKHAEAVRNARDRLRLAVPEDVRKAAAAVRRKTLDAALPDTAGIADKAPADDSPLKTLTQGARTATVSETLVYFIETLRLLKARAAFLVGLVSQGNVARTDPGFGRVDAFGGARNLMFPQNAGPLTAPVSYPHLWNLDQIVWLHWDGNSTSLLERNVGQALGLGAVFVPGTFESTALPEHLVELEKLARKITPPAWPAHAFGAIDQAKAKRGAEVFARYCQACHRALEANGNMGDHSTDLKSIGTDPLRVVNFGQAVGAEEFDVALSRVLKDVARKAGGTVRQQKEWRTTVKGYANRPLVAAWATAPYLHNNSVPTLHDLLLPADQRPRKFWVGSREYDAQKLGYQTAEDDTIPQSLVDTSLPGNSNAGHSGPQYGTSMTEEERADLLEYLKGL